MNIIKEFDALISDAPLDFMGTGTGDEADHAESCWNKKVESFKSKLLDIEFVRKGLRGSLLDLILNITAYKFGGIDKEGADNLKLLAQNLVVFGLNTKLFEQEEASEWDDVISGKKLLGEVAGKWNKEQA